MITTESKYKNNIFLFLIEYFNSKEETTPFNLNSCDTLEDIKKQLKKINLKTKITTVETIIGSGFCIINVSYLKEKKKFVFCVFDTIKDDFRYFDYETKASYYSSTDVFKNLVFDRECLVFLN
tara:strand:- start:572 stop:940 length:369 start_codon:yes stop_codon:yes gene_type:complete